MKQTSRIFLAFLAVLVFCTLMLGQPQPARAISFLVTTTADSGTGSLRQALFDANSSAGADAIEFNIAGSPPFVIDLASALPIITDPVTIDGATQPGYNGTPIIVLNGTNAGSNVNGLTITGGGSTIRGLVINRFSRHGIRVETGTGNIIEANYIGTDVTGTLDQGNILYGVSIVSSNNRVGGLFAGAGNVISGNDFGGIIIGLGTGAPLTGNIVQGNIVGLNAAGTTDLGNTFTGIWVRNSTAPVVGGTSTAARNIISGNSTYGLQLDAVSEAVVEGNYIGTNISGTTAIPNDVAGVYILNASNNRVGGTAAGARNVISGNGYGVLFNVLAGTTSGNLVQGNIIGLDVTGTTIVGNTNTGVALLEGVSGNTIGGNIAGARNIISGNDDGVGIQGTNNSISGNYIGTDITGTLGRGNSDDGVVISATGTANTVGGIGASSRNLISGNGGDGIEMSANSTLSSNFIGTDITGTVDLGNSENGVEVLNAPGGTISLSLISGNEEAGIWLDSSSGVQINSNTIGLNLAGTASIGNASYGVYIAFGAGNVVGGAGGGNVIVGSGSAGIFVESDSHDISGNLIYRNGGLGIDLAPEGITPNDAGDADTGANDLLNFPIITGATVASGSITVTGTYNSVPNQAFTVSLYSSQDCDTSGNGEGQYLVGQQIVNTDGAGNGSFNASFPVQPGNFITALARSSTAASEFSPCFAVTAASAEMIRNGNFSGGMANWVTFGSPTSAAITHRISNGVFEFYRNTGTQSALVLQNTGVAVPADTRLELSVDLGNSSAQRKRVTLLIHEASFSDIAICTFWLPAGTPLQRYTAYTHTGIAWANATLSVYASTADSAGWIQMDNVSMKRYPGVSAGETRCIDPLAPTSADGNDTANALTNANFASGALSPWIAFGQVTQRISGGVLEVTRRTGTPPAVVYQNTTLDVPEAAPLELQFRLGNSSPTVRQQVTVLMHAASFADLQACTFWIEPNTPLSTYIMRAYASTAWTDVSLSIYPRTVTTTGYIRVDDVVLRHRPGMLLQGTGCFEPGSVAAELPDEAVTELIAPTLEPTATPLVSELPPDESLPVATPAPAEAPVSEGMQGE
jgi:hypothetical protein